MTMLPSGNPRRIVMRVAGKAHDDAAFWQPAPLLQRLVAEGKTFN